MPDPFFADTMDPLEQRLRRAEEERRRLEESEAVVRMRQQHEQKIKEYERAKKYGPRPTYKKPDNVDKWAWSEMSSEDQHRAVISQKMQDPAYISKFEQMSPEELQASVDSSFAKIASQREKEIQKYREEQPFEAGNDETLSSGERLVSKINHFKRRLEDPAYDRKYGGGSERLARGVIRRLPVTGAIWSAMTNHDRAAITKRISEGNPEPGDYDALGMYIAEAEHKAKRKGWVKAADIASYIPGYATEFFMSGGAYAAGRAATQKAALRGLGAAGVSAGARGAPTAVQLAGFAGGVGRQTVAAPMWGRIADEFLRRRDPGFKLRGRKGSAGYEVVANTHDKSIGKHAYEALWSHYIELMSERMGGTIMKGLGKASGVGWLASKLPESHLKEVGRGVLKRAGKFSQATGLSLNPIEESLEEIAGSAMKGSRLTAAEDPYLANLVKDYLLDPLDKRVQQSLWAEVGPMLGAFAIAGVAGGILSAAQGGRSAEIRQQIEEQEEILKKVAEGSLESIKAEQIIEGLKEEERGGPAMKPPVEPTPLNEALETIKERGGLDVSKFIGDELEELKRASQDPSADYEKARQAVIDKVQVGDQETLSRRQAEAMFPNVDVRPEVLRTKAGREGFLQGLQSSRPIVESILKETDEANLEYRLEDQAVRQVDRPVTFETTTEQALAEQAAAEQVPVEQVPVEQVQAEQVPAEQVPAEQVPVEQVPAEQVPVEQVVTEETEVPTLQPMGQPVTQERSELGTNKAIIRMLIADADAATGRQRNALNTAVEILRTHPEELRDLENIGDIRKIEKVGAGVGARIASQIGKALIQEGKPAEAAEYFEKASKWRKDVPEYAESLAEAQKEAAEAPEPAPVPEGKPSDIPEGVKVIELEPGEIPRTRLGEELSPVDKRSARLVAQPGISEEDDPKRVGKTMDRKRRPLRKVKKFLAGLARTGASITQEEFRKRSKQRKGFYVAETEAHLVEKLGLSSASPRDLVNYYIKKEPELAGILALGVLEKTEHTGELGDEARIDVNFTKSGKVKKATIYLSPDATLSTLRHEIEHLRDYIHNFKPKFFSVVKSGGVLKRLFHAEFGRYGLHDYFHLSDYLHRQFVRDALADPQVRKKIPAKVLKQHIKDYPDLAERYLGVGEKAPTAVSKTQEKVEPTPAAVEAAEGDEARRVRRDPAAGEMSVDIFYLPERSKAALGDKTWDEYWDDNQHKVKLYTTNVPVDATLEDIKKKWREAGLPKGSARGGPFQVQTDKGTWDHRSGKWRNIFLAKPDNVVFRTDEEIEEDYTAQEKAKKEKVTKPVKKATAPQGVVEEGRPEVAPPDKSKERAEQAGKYADEAVYRKLVIAAGKIKTKKIHTSVAQSDGTEKMVWLVDMGSGLAFPDPKMPGGRVKPIVVTHIKSGYKAVGVHSQGEARLFQLLSTELGLSWDFADPKEISAADKKLFRRIKDVVDRETLDGLTEREKDLLVGLYPPTTPTIVEADIVLDRYDLDPKIRPLSSEKGLEKVRQLVAEVPEFRHNPVFRVEREHEYRERNVFGTEIPAWTKERLRRYGQKRGFSNPPRHDAPKGDWLKWVEEHDPGLRLIFEDGYRFKFHPETFNLDQDELKEWMTVGVNLEDLGIEPFTELQTVAAIFRRKGLKVTASPSKGTVKIKGSYAVRTGEHEWKSEDPEIQEVLDKIVWTTPSFDRKPVEKEVKELLASAEAEAKGKAKPTAAPEAAEGELGEQASLDAKAFKRLEESRSPEEMVTVEGETKRWDQVVAEAYTNAQDSGGREFGTPEEQAKFWDVALGTLEMSEDNIAEPADPEEDEGDVSPGVSMSDAKATLEDPKLWRKAFDKFWDWYAPFTKDINFTNNTFKKNYQRFMNVGGLLGKEAYTELQMNQGQVESDLMLVYQALADLDRLILSSGWGAKKKILEQYSAMERLTEKQRSDLGRLGRTPLKNIDRVAKTYGVPSELLEPIKKIRRLVDSLGKRMMDLLAPDIGPEETKAHIESRADQLKQLLASVEEGVEIPDLAEKLPDLLPKGLLDDPDFEARYGGNVLDIMLELHGSYFTRTFQVFDRNAWGEILREQAPMIQWTEEAEPGKRGKRREMPLLDAFKRELRDIDYQERLFQKRDEIYSELKYEVKDAYERYKMGYSAAGTSPGRKVPPGEPITKEDMTQIRIWMKIPPPGHIKRDPDFLEEHIPIPVEKQTLKNVRWFMEEQARLTATEDAKIFLEKVGREKYGRVEGRLTEEELEGRIDQILHPKRKKAGLVRKTMGRVDYNVFIARKLHNKKFHILLRKVMGEYRDRLDINAVRTVERLSSVLAQTRSQEYLMEIAKERKWVHVVKGRVSKVGIRTRDELPIQYRNPIPDAPEFGPFRGAYVTDTFEQALKDEFGTGYGEPSVLQEVMTWGIFRIYGKMMGSARLSKTLLSSTVQVRNWSANAAIAIVHGHIPMDRTVGQAFADAFRTTRELHWRAGKHEDKPSTKIDGKTIREYVRELLNFGVVFDSPADELASMLETTWDMPILSVMQDGPNIVDAGKIANVQRQAKRGASKVLHGSASLYRAGDDFWKVLGFGMELKTLKEAFPDESSIEDLPKNQGWEKFTGDRTHWLKKTAALRIRDIYPTFSNAPNWVQVIRWFPIMGTFPTYFEELIRTQYYEFWKMANRDLKSGNSVLMRRAQWRIARWTLANVAAGTVIKSLLRLVMMMIPGWSPLDGDDEEKMRDLEAPWAENSVLFGFKNDKTGAVYSVDLSYMLPYSRPSGFYQAIRRGKTLGAKIGGAAYEVGGDVLTADMVYTKLFEMWYGETKEGRKIFEKEDPARDRWVRSILHAWGAWEPGLMNSSVRTVMGIADVPSFTGRKYRPGVEVLAATTGSRITQINVPRSFSFKATEFANNLRTDKRILEAQGRSAFKPFLGIFSGSVKQVSRRLPLAEKVRRRHFVSMINDIDTALHLGATEEEVVAALKRNGISRELIFALMNRGYVPYLPSDNMVRQIRESYAGEEKLAIMEKHILEEQKKERDRRASGKSFPGLRPPSKETK